MSLLSVKKSEQMENQPEENVVSFVCDLCDKVFDKKGHMSNHRILVHTIKREKNVLQLLQGILQYQARAV